MDLTAKVQAFVQKYQGQMIAFQNNAEVPQGSCMNVPHQFIYEVLGLTDPHIIYGQFAYEVYTNFANLPASKYFTLIANTTTNVPTTGDIPIFGQSNDTPDGHICLFVTGDVNSFTSFDMDYPYGTPAHLQLHNYTNLLGWLHYNDPTVSPTQNVSVNDQQSADLLNAQIAATSQCQSQLKASQDQVTTLQNQLTTEQDTVSSLQGELKDAKSQIATLQAQLDGEQKEIISLNHTIETQASSNKDYATETLDLTHANNDLTNYLYATADKLGVNRTSKVNADIEEAILAKLDEVDTLLKAANLTEGLLHNMATTLQLNDPNASDQQIANNIITYVKGLQGKLQSILPKKQVSVEPAIQSQQNFLSKLVGWFWQSKT